MIRPLLPVCQRYRLALWCTAALWVSLPRPAHTQQSLPPAIQQRIDSVAMDELRRVRAPGATLTVVIGDRVVYARAYGVANVENGTPMTPDLVMRLGSTTKMMTSLAALRLAERGVVGLDRPIGELAPAITAPRLRTLTLRQLLTHNAGLLDYTSFAGPHDDVALNDFIPTLTDTAFFTDPADVFSYSNLGYSIAGYVLSTAAKKPYAEVMADEVFKPLGMSRSTLRPIEAMTFPMAQGHNVSREGVFTVARPAPDDSRYWPAGSVFTSALDFARLVIALLNEGRVDGREVIPSATVRLLMTPQVALPAGMPGPAGQYAFGLDVSSANGRLEIEHSGSRGGYGSLMRLVPEKKIGAVAMANRTGVALSATLNAVIDALAGPAPRAAAPSPPGDSATVDMLLGTWINRRGEGALTFQAQGEEVALVVASGGGPAAPVTVRQGGRNVFQAGNQRFVLVKGSSGSVRYLMSGTRAYRRTEVVTPRR